MARINIEMSAALEQWIDVMRLDWDRYLRLMYVASARLPMTRKSVSKGDALSLLPLASSQLAALMGLVTTQSLGTPEVWAETQAHPTRVLSNALVHWSLDAATLPLVRLYGPEPAVAAGG